MLPSSRNLRRDSSWFLEYWMASFSFSLASGSSRSTLMEGIKHLEDEINHLKN